MPREYRAIAAIVLALGITVSAILLCMETILHPGAISSEEATVLSTVLGASVGAVATYLGGAKVDNPHRPDSNTDEPEP